MNNTELKKKIASEATDLEWFKNLETEIVFPYLNYSQKIKGVSALFEFVNQQIKGWERLGDNIPDELKQSKNYFKGIKDNIENFVNNYIGYDRNNLSSYWINNIVISKDNIISNGIFPILYESSEVGFLLNTYKEGSEIFQGAWSVITNPDSIQAQGNKKTLYGKIRALEFLNNDKTGISGRIEKEKKSLSELKNNFQEYLSRSELELLEHLKNGNLKYEEYTKKIDELKTEKESTFNTWFETTKTEEWEKWYKDKQAHILNLEETYEEKLKFEAPAKYWKNRGFSLRFQGFIGMLFLILLVFIVYLSLAKILQTAPKEIYLSWFGEDKSAAVRWAIIYVTMITFIGYCIKAITKFMFSSFHLARDAEERYTLTYFYLSLLKDSSVEKEDRQLIMQSLFSRAETGLLKDDSSPSMPNSIDFSKFFKS